MPDDFVNPVDHVESARPIEGRGAASAPGPVHHATVSGRVIAIHRRTSKHAEKHRRLDASVGAQTHSELVIQIDEGDVGDLVGKRVAIHYRED
jgi:hypothetical protein